MQCALTCMLSKNTFNAVFGFNNSPDIVISMVLMKLIADTPTTLSFLVVDISSTTLVKIPLLPSLVGIVLVTVVSTLIPLLLLLLNLLLLNLLPLSSSNSSGSSPKLLFSRKFPTLLVTLGTPAHVCCQSFHTVPSSTPANTASKLPS